MHPSPKHLPAMPTAALRAYKAELLQLHEENGGTEYLRRAAEIDTLISDRPACRYFALCDRVADGLVAHPILPDVPTCTRCAERVGVELQAFPADTKENTK